MISNAIKLDVNANSTELFLLPLLDVYVDDNVLFNKFYMNIHRCGLNVIGAKKETLKVIESLKNKNVLDVDLAGGFGRLWWWLDNDPNFTRQIVIDVWNETIKESD